MRALVVGGTGPTGPPIVNGLRERGYEVTVLHRGRHEVDLPPQVTHVHADPYDGAALAEALAGERFALCLGMYGRLRLLIEAIGDRVEHVVTVGGTAYDTDLAQRATEETARLTTRRFYRRIVETEELLASAHAEGRFEWAHLRYPHLYGPRQVAPREWCVIRRLRDGRRRIPVLEGCLTLQSRLYTENAAQAVLTLCDQPERASGRIYNVADRQTPSDADRVRLMAEIMDVGDVELVSMPRGVPSPAWIWGIGRGLDWVDEGSPPPVDHQLVDDSRIRDELGYTDRVGLREAMAATINWYLENPPEPGGEVEQHLGDPFDYEAEDQFFAWYDRFVQELGALEFPGIGYRHPYLTAQRT